MSCVVYVGWIQVFGAIWMVGQANKNNRLQLFYSQISNCLTLGRSSWPKNANYRKFIKPLGASALVLCNCSLYLRADDIIQFSERMFGLSFSIQHISALYRGRLGPNLRNDCRCYITVDCTRCWLNQSRVE